jgi:hypothetical protein
MQLFFTTPTPLFQKPIIHTAIANHIPYLTLLPFHPTFPTIPKTNERHEKLLKNMPTVKNQYLNRPGKC